jgi:hypothetical protein
MLISLAIGSFAQAPSQTPDPAKKQTYEEMLSKLKAGETTTDFKAFRLAFTRTKQYGPYGGDRDGRKLMNAALSQKNFKEALKKAEEQLKDDYTDMEAHIVASIANKELGNSAKADFHRELYLGLVNSIISGGDGKTAKTAYVVITTNEEYVVLRALGLAPGSQSLVKEEGHTFDVFAAIDQKTKAESKVYFNIDIPWKAENDMFNPKD